VAAYGCLAAASRPAHGVTLQDLLNGASIEAGAARFHDWSLLGLNWTATPAPNLAQIAVLPLVDDLSRPGVELLSNGPLSTTGINAIDLWLQFRVDALAGGPTFAGQSLELAGVTFGGPGGVVYASQETTTLSGVDLSATVAMADNAAEIFQWTGSSTFVPRLNVRATANVFVTGLVTSDVVNLTKLRVRMLQNGPLSVPGDFDGDGDVDTADLAQWRGDFGVNDDSDADSDGDSDGVDFLTWQRSAAIPEPGIMSVPEPGGAALAFVLAALAGIRGRSVEACA
jgi:hypothetical protein